MVHQYGAESDVSRKGKCRLVSYMDYSIPEVRFQPSIDPNLVLVSVKALAEAFFKGVDSFLVDTFANKEKAAVAESRIQRITHEVSVEDVMAEGPP